MSIPDIIDNLEYQLFDVLNELLKTGKPADFASGFFNIGGYALVRDKRALLIEIQMQKEDNSMIQNLKMRTT